MDLESLVAKSKDMVSAIIDKPKMTEKYLGKPPFRFLHDTITAIINKTGFGEGLMSGDELNSATITDKAAKIAYLEKVFNFVGVCKGQVLDVRAAKVVSGLEPENTNLFLIALAECASDSAYDSNAAVECCLGGEQAGTGPPALKAQAQNHSHSPAGAEAKGKSRGGTRGGKPARESTDVGLGGVSGRVDAPNLDIEVERCDGSVALTQEMLGSLITKPKLTDKLLNKPPFRFLFDIIMEVKKVSGFGEGLYTAAEHDSSSFTDKNGKMQYLEKIIRLVGVQLNTIVEARPAKIVAGLDANLTNSFLQLLAVCAKSNPDSSGSVGTVLDQMGVEGGEIPAPRLGAEDKPQAAEPKFQQDDRQEIGASSKKIEGERREIGSSNAKSTADEGEDGEAKRTGRPTTARRRPPKVKDGAKEVDKQGAPTKKAEGIMTDGADDDDEDEIVDESDNRLADDEAARNPNTGKSAQETPTDDAAAKGMGGGIREGDMERLRASIQTLVQHTGPLGGCLDYLQEDVGLMNIELRKWEEECRKFEARVQTEKSKTVEVLHPLESDLAEIEAQIAERVASISAAKSNISRNEDRLLQLLKLVSST
eukprot:GSChrysophyteH2.ASY1.ANO1.1061.1 assembled CDS